MGHQDGKNYIPNKIQRTTPGSKFYEEPEPEVVTPTPVVKKRKRTPKKKGSKRKGSRKIRRKIRKSSHNS